MYLKERFELLHRIALYKYWLLLELRYTWYIFTGHSKQGSLPSTDADPGGHTETYQSDGDMKNVDLIVPFNGVDTPITIHVVLRKHVFKIV